MRKVSPRARGRGRGSQITGDLVDVGGYCRKWRGFAGICGGWPAPPPQNRKPLGHVQRKKDPLHVCHQSAPVKCHRAKRLPQIPKARRSSRITTSSHRGSSESRLQLPALRSLANKPSSARSTQLTPWNRQPDTIFRHSPASHKLSAREKCGRHRRHRSPLAPTPLPVSPSCHLRRRGEASQ